jgi:nascent polypeptide-associated complex subunit beta
MEDEEMMLAARQRLA